MELENPPLNQCKKAVVNQCHGSHLLINRYFCYPVEGIEANSENGGRLGTGLVTKGIAFYSVFEELLSTGLEVLGIGFAQKGLDLHFIVADQGFLVFEQNAHEFFPVAVATIRICFPFLRLKSVETDVLLAGRQQA